MDIIKVFKVLFIISLWLVLIKVEGWYFWYAVLFCAVLLTTQIL